MLLLEMPMRQHYERQGYQFVYNSSIAVMLREMQREVNIGRPFETRLHIDYSTNNHHSQLAQQIILVVVSWPFSHGENRLDPGL